MRHGIRIQLLALTPTLICLFGFLLLLLGWNAQKPSAQQLVSKHDKLPKNRTSNHHTSDLDEKGRETSLLRNQPLAFNNSKNDFQSAPGHGGEHPIVGEPMSSLLTSNLSWIPADEEERQEYTGNGTCFGPLKHCCIGQCRQPFYSIPSTDCRLFRKPSVRLSNLTDLLHLLETRVKIPPENACRLVLLLGDHMAALICQLYRLGYKSVKCINKEKFGTDKRYGEKGYCSPRQNGPGPFTLVLERQTEVCPNVTLQMVRSGEYDHTSSLEPESSGIMVWSDGAHRNEPGEIREYIKENFVNMVLNMQTNFPKWHILFLEHEPQHFKTPDGTFRDKVERCSPLTPQNTSNWRNQEAAKTIAEENLQVPIVPLYQQMIPLWDLHIGKGDCTHYCYTPWRFDVSWHGIIEAVEAKLDNNQRNR